MDDVIVCPALLVDRHYRGAIVMTRAASFALPEPLIALVERVQRARGLYVPDDGERDAIAALVARGILERSGS